MVQINLIKATLVTGEPIFINEFKIESIWIDLKKEECHVILESGNNLIVKKEFFDNLTKTKVVK